MLTACSRVHLTICCCELTDEVLNESDLSIAEHLRMYLLCYVNDLGAANALVPLLYDLGPE